MLTEKQLIGKIKELRQIKPSQNWVSFTKSQILGEDEKKSFVPLKNPAFGENLDSRSARIWNYGFNNFRLRFAMASILTIMIMLGSYGIVERSLPGDLLYIARRAVHKAQTVLLPDQEKPAYQLKLANDRLNDLANAPARNLAPTISELQANISEAARDLAKIDAATSSPGVIKQIVEQTQELKENMKIAASLGFTTGDIEATGELDKATAEYLIKYLDTLTLTEEKAKTLDEMKELFREGKYSETLEFFWNYFYLTNQYNK